MRHHILPRLPNPFRPSPAVLKPILGIPKMRYTNQDWLIMVSNCQCEDNLSVSWSGLPCILLVLQIFHHIENTNVGSSNKALEVVVMRDDLEPVRVRAQSTIPGGGLPCCWRCQRILHQIRSHSSMLCCNDDRCEQQQQRSMMVSGGGTR